MAPAHRCSRSADLSHRLARTWCVLLIGLLASPGFAADERGRIAGFRPRVFALAGARLVISPDREIPDGTLVVRDGLIVAAGSDVDIPRDAVTIDAAGLVIYPGFIDADAGDLLAATVSLPASPGRQVNFSRYVLAATRPDNRKGLTPQFVVRTALALDASRLASIRRSGFTAVHVVPTGRIASGIAGLVTTGGGPPRESLLAGETTASMALMVPGGTGYPRTLMGATVHLRQAMLDARWHARHRRLYRDASGGVPPPPVDPVLVALDDVLDNRRRPLFRADTRDDIHRALDFCDEHGLKPILCGGAEAHRCLDRLVAAGVPLLMSLDFGDQPVIKSLADDATLTAERADPLRVQRDRQRRWADRVAGPGRLAAAGVPLAFGSRGLKDRGAMLAAIRQAITAGLTRRQALAALTVVPARLLGVERRVGTLEPGRLAHLAAWTADFDRPDSKVRYVVVDGRLFDADKPKPAEESEQKPVPARRSPAAAPAAPAPPTPRREVVGAALPTEIEDDRLARPIQTGGDVLIQGGTVLTGTGRTLPGTSIKVRRGRIVAIAADLEPDPGMTVIDATGRFVMPGIIDTHSHIKISGGVNESSQSIVPEVRVRDVINTADVSEYRALAGGVTTARLFHGSANVIGGQDAVVKLKYGAVASRQALDDAPRGVKFALGENVKFRTSRFPNTRMGVEATLNRAFFEAVDYRRRWLEHQRATRGKTDHARLAPRRDLRLEALADIVNHKKFIHSHCYRADEILMLLRVSSQLGIRVWSLQHVLEGYKIAPEIVAHGASCSTFADWWAYKVEAYDATPYNAALLHEAGANVVIKSDDRELMRHLYHEAAKPVRYGNLPVERALSLITLNAARELGLDDRIGSIETGKQADLAIFNAHPLNAFARCEMTLIEGEVYFSREHQPTVMSREGVARTRRPPSLEFPSGEVRDRKLEIEPAASGRYALVGGTLHPVDAPPLPGGTLLIDRGLIQALGTDVAPPKDARVVDVTGLHVYPGLIDAGTTLGLAEIGKVQATLDFAEGGGLQPDLRAGVAINPDSELFPVSRAGGITLALVRPTGGLVAGQASLVRLAGWTAPDMVLDYEAGLQVNWPGGAPKQVRQRIDELRELLEQARTYDRLVTAAVDGQEPIGDPRLEALRPYLHRKKPVFIEAHSRRQIAEALLFAEKEKLSIVITGGTDAWKLARHLKDRKVPVIIGPVMRRPVSPYDPADAPYANPGRLHEAGVAFCIRSDSASNSRNAPFEAAMAVAHGLPEQAGLRAVTLSAAEVLGVAGQVGSLTVGKQANLVIADGSPLQITTQIKGVFVGGRPFPPESRQTRFYERYRQRLKEIRNDRD